MYMLSNNQRATIFQERVLNQHEKQEKESGGRYKEGASCFRKLKMCSEQIFEERQRFIQ
jgi:hypothetical protein